MLIANLVKSLTKMKNNLDFTIHDQDWEDNVGGFGVRMLGLSRDSGLREKLNEILISKYDISYDHDIPRACLEIFVISN